MPDGKHRGRKSTLSATQQFKAIALLSTVPATAVAKHSDVHPLHAATTASLSHRPSFMGRRGLPL